MQTIITRHGEDKLATKVFVSSEAGFNVTSPLPGNILQIKVQNGQSVKAGDVLIIIEAMKMENEVLAPQDGTVKQILVNKGAVVATGDVLVVI